MESEVFSSLIEGFYDAALEPERWHLASADMARVGFAEALQRGKVAAFVVSRYGWILSVNGAGEKLLSRGDLITARNGVLAGTEHRASNELIRLINAACSDADDEPIGGGSATLIDDAGRPRAIWVTALPRRDLGLGLGLRSALVVVHGSEPLAVTAEDARRLFGLTIREADVALALAHGLSLDQAAHGLGMSKETARFHLRNIFGKTNMARQADLVGLLLRAAG